MLTAPASPSTNSGSMLDATKTVKGFLFKQLQCARHAALVSSILRAQAYTLHGVESEAEGPSS